jgi:tRNA(Ile)-lysidine synthase
MIGIPVVRGSIVRPLLFARRSETIAYCERQDLAYLSDECNQDKTFARVRARLDLVPAFESLHPGAFENLLRAVNIVRSDNEILDGLTRLFMEAARIRSDSPLAFLSEQVESRYHLDRLAPTPLPILRRMIRMAAREFGADLDFDQTTALAHAIQTSSRISITSESSKCVVEIGARYMSVRNPEPAEPFDLPLDPHSGAAHDGWRIEPVAAAENGRMSARICFQHAAGVRARSYRPGDRMVPVGKTRETKLKDLFDANRIGREVRSRVPVIADDAGPIWVPGVALAARSRHESGPENAVCLQFRPESTDSTV